jgi:N-formylglutamate deformylase
MTAEAYEFRGGSAPLLVSMPHSGTFMPSAVQARMTEAALRLPDTDWHIPQLYDFLEEIGASVLQATHSRYFIDLNRSPDGRPLYPGQDNTELCPTTTFDGQPVYKPGQVPPDVEVAERRDLIWQPYHDRLANELAGMRERHGIALLWDAHSIKSEVPRFFDGKLPDLNLGTGDGLAAGESLVDLLLAVARDAEENLGYTHVLNGRFKGGYITRYHGRPRTGIHAVQLELSQATYMDEAHPFTFRKTRAKKIRPVLKGLLQSMLAWAELEIAE